MVVAEGLPDDRELIEPDREQPRDGAGRDPLIEGGEEGAAVWEPGGLVVAARCTARSRWWRRCAVRVLDPSRRLRGEQPDEGDAVGLGAGGRPLREADHGGEGAVGA